MMTAVDRCSIFMYVGCVATVSMAAKLVVLDLVLVVTGLDSIVMDFEEIRRLLLW